MADHVQGAVILIVENDAIIALNIEDSLLDLGYRVLGPLATGSETMALLGSQQPDAVLLNLKLDDGIAIDVAKALLRLSIPVALLTGAELSDLDPELQTIPCLNKPFTNTQLEKMLLQLIRRGDDGGS